MTSGNFKNCFWIEWETCFLSTLLRWVPEIVIGRYLVNTSFDSGTLTVSEEERNQGWYSIGDFTYSPCIRDVLPVPTPEFDEWLVFAEPTEIEVWEPFVNYADFSLDDINCESYQKQFWSQIEKVRPESYLAEGDRLIFATRNRRVHEIALSRKNLEGWPPEYPS
jgi:hypothetical protein